MAHECTKSDDIKELKMGQQKLNAAIFGNGVKGLKTSVAELTLTTSNLIDIIKESKEEEMKDRERRADREDKLNTVISGIMKFQNEWAIKEAEREKFREETEKAKLEEERKKATKSGNIKWGIGLGVTILFTLIGYIIKLKAGA